MKSIGFRSMAPYATKSDCKLHQPALQLCIKTQDTVRDRENQRGDNKDEDIGNVTTICGKKQKEGEETKDIRENPRNGEREDARETERERERFADMILR